MGTRYVEDEQQIAWQYQCVREDWLEEDKEVTHQDD